MHREWMSAVLEKRPGLSKEYLVNTQRLMDASTLNCKVTDYDLLVPGLKLPDPDDRHILAAAAKASASVIVTFNEKDFPSNALEPFGLHTRHPDQFILDLESLDSASLIEQARKDWRHYRAPELSFQAYLDGLRAAGVPRTATFFQSVEVLFSSTSQGN